MLTFRALRKRGGSYEPLASVDESNESEVCGVEIVEIDARQKDTRLLLLGFKAKYEPKQLTLRSPCVLAKDSYLSFRFSLKKDTAEILKVEAGTDQKILGLLDFGLYDEIQLTEQWQRLDLRILGGDAFETLGLDVDRRERDEFELCFPVVDGVPIPAYRAFVRCRPGSRLWLFDRHLRGLEGRRTLYQFTDAAAARRSWHPDQILLVDGVPWEPGRQLWNAFADSYSSGLELASGHPASFVPKIDEMEQVGDGAPSWRAVYRVRDTTISAGGEARFATTPAVDSNLIESLALNLASAAELPVSFPLIQTHGGASVRAVVEVAPPALDEASATTRWNDSLEQGLVLQGMKAVRARSADPSRLSRNIRMGALDVVLAEPSVTGPDLKENGFVQIRPGSSQRGEELEPTWVSTAIETVEARLAIALASIEAGSQDQIGPSGGDCRTSSTEVTKLLADDQVEDLARLEGLNDEATDCLFARRPSLVIGGVLAEGGRSGNARGLHLEVVETTGSPRRTLELMVRRQEKENDGRVTPKAVRTANDSAVILDPDPFLIALVSFPALVSDEYENTIATWRYDGFGAPAWRFRLGPDQKVDLRLPPQGVGEEMERYGNVDPDEPVDFRFSPPARIRFRESIRAREFALAPWNVRQLFGDDRAELPGVVVEELDYELLYGLACSFPAGPAGSELIDRPLLRMADLFALVGAAPGPLPSRPRWLPRDEGQRASARRTYQQVRRHWAQLYDQLQARLGVLEAWNPYAAPSLSRKLQVECKIRSTAELATAADTCGGKLLCGGVLYGIEQPAVYRALLVHQAKKQPSDSARVDDLALSSLGGWGHQTATFGVMTVIAEVAMGRTHTLRIEVLGRMACSWNRARHVVVYERTPGPSRQFVCYQNGHLRRPLLRKTQEFVEILQPRRDYPDSAVADPRFTGPVRAWAFEEGAKFNVLSFWGVTVGENGWKIPIWRRDQQPSDLYPEPVVTVVADSSVEGERREQPCVLANPEDVYFYTEFSDRGAEPDHWPPIVEIECVDFGAEQACRDFQAGKLEPASPADMPIPPGLAQCSFRLKPIAHGVDLTAERAGQAPVGAHLSVLTFSRGVLPAPGLEKPRSVRSALATALAATREPGGGDFDELRLRLRGTIEEARRRVEMIDESAVRSALERIWASDKKRVSQWLGFSEQAAERSGLVVKIEQRLGDWKRALEPPTSELDAAARKVEDDASQVAELVTNTAREELARVSGALGTASRSALGWLRRAREEVGRFGRTAAALKEAFDAAGDEEERSKRADRAAATLRAELLGIGGLLQAPLQLTTVRIEVDESSLPTSLPSAISLLPAAWRDDLEALLAWARGTSRDVETRVEECIALVQTMQQEIDGKIEDCDKAIQSLEGEFDKLLETVEKQVEELVGGAGEDLSALIAEVESEVNGWFGSAWGEVQGRLDEVFATGSQPALQIVDAASFAKSKLRLEGAYRQLEADLVQGDLEDTIEAAQQGLVAIAGLADEVEREARQAADAGLRLVRAFGKPPEVEGLQFSRPEIAYFFDEASNAVGLTPVIARAQQVSAVADALKPIGIDLPAVALADNVIPAALKDFDLSSILPNVAGIDFKGLFPELKMPNGSEVQVRHGIDPETRRPWLQANFEVEQTGRHELFSTSGLSLYASSPLLNGKTRVEVGANGSLRRETQGLMKSTWELAIGGRTLIRFVDTVVTFDGDGNFHFDFSPDRIELDATLAFVQNFLSGLLPGDPPVRIEPTGVVAELFLPVPGVSGGFVGINNLSIGCQFALRFVPEFAIEAGFNLAKPEAPFTLTIFVLGGAGYVTAATRYSPSTGKAMTRLDMAIAVSASLSLSLGPIEGGVFVYLGINARYDDASRGGLLVAFFILVRGHVSVLGIASATITLRLEASYDQSRNVQGKGTISIRIKICWCFTLNVEKSVTYQLGKGGGGSDSADLGLPGPTIRLARAGDGTWALPDVHPPQDPQYKTIFHQRVAEYLEMVA